MKRYADWSLRAKLGLIVGSLIAAIVLVSGYAIHALNSYHRTVGQIEDASARALHAETVNGLIYANVMDGRGAMRADTQEKADRYAAGMEKHLQGVREQLQAWQPLVRPEDEPAFAELEASIDDYFGLREGFIQAARRDGAAGALEFTANNSSRVQRQRLNAALDDLKQRNDALVAQLAEQERKTFSASIWTLAALCLGGALPRRLPGSIDRIMDRGVTLRDRSSDGDGQSRQRRGQRRL